MSCCGRICTSNLMAVREIWDIFPALFYKIRFCKITRGICPKYPEKAMRLLVNPIPSMLLDASIFQEIESNSPGYRSQRYKLNSIILSNQVGTNFSLETLHKFY